MRCWVGNTVIQGCPKGRVIPPVMRQCLFALVMTHDMREYLTGYKLVKSGRNCNWVTSKEECERAAEYLGAGDTTAGVGSWGKNPPGCFLLGAAGDNKLLPGKGHLYKNNIDDNTSCDHGGYFWCICKT